MAIPLKETPYDHGPPPIKPLSLQGKQHHSSTKGDSTRRNTLRPRATINQIPSLAGKTVFTQQFSMISEPVSFNQ